MAWSRQANQASILYQATLTLSLSGKIDYNLLTFKLVLCNRLHNKRIITRQDVWFREDFLKASLGCWVYSYSSLIMIKNLGSGNIKMYIVYICHWFFGRGQMVCFHFHLHIIDDTGSTAWQHLVWCKPGWCGISLHSAYANSESKALLVAKHAPQARKKQWLKVSNKCQNTLFWRVKD